METSRPSLAAKLSGIALPDAFEYTAEGAQSAKTATHCVVAGWIICALMPVAGAAAWGSRHGSGAAIAAFLIISVIALVICAATAFSLSRASVIAAIATAVGTFVLTFATTSLLVVVLGLAQIGVLIAAMAVRAKLKATRPIVPRPDDQLLAPRVIGEPGVGLMSHQAINESGMHIDNLRKGMIGEQLSHELFVKSVAEAGLTNVIQIVHGLKFPGSANADIDHALVCANRVVLVDSKYWAPMPYRWFGDVVMGGIGENQQPRATNFNTAIGMVRQMFGSVEVGGAVLVHPNGPGRLSVDNTQMRDHPPLIAAPEGIGPLLNWLRAGLPSDSDQYRRLQSHSMRMVLSITDGFAPPVVQATPLAPIASLAPGMAPPSAVGATLRSTGSEAASIGRWYLARRRRKRAEFNARVAHETARRNSLHAKQMQRRSDQVLRMQHDELNSQRPVWNRKKW